MNGNFKPLLINQEGAFFIPGKRGGGGDGPGKRYGGGRHRHVQIKPKHPASSKKETAEGSAKGLWNPEMRRS
jgi:hypothetical protein